MMKARVTRIIDGDTFRIRPKWLWYGKSGDKIRPAGYNARERGEEEFRKAKLRLKKIILGKVVDLNPIKMSYDRLLCDVYINNVNLAKYFPEYQ